jgi:hypothetical protein
MERLPLMTTHTCVNSKQDVLKPIQQALATILDEEDGPFEVVHKCPDFETAACDQSLLADCDGIARCAL